MKAQLAWHNSKNESIRWYALIGFYPEMHQILFRSIKGHNVWPLYVKTALDRLLEHSPYIVELLENDEIINTLPKEKMVLFAASTEVTSRQVVDHLRQRMTIIFDGNKKGLLHYYLPEIASYFFSANSNDTADWLGMLTGVQWFNQIAGQEPEWLNINNEWYSEKSKDWLLTPAQEEKLNQQWVDKLIAQWAQAEQVASVDWDRLRSAYVLSDQLDITQLNDVKRIFSFVTGSAKAIPNFSEEMSDIKTLSDSQKVDLLETRMKDINHVS
ncbi:DUF4123 domain-containing protein [Vibrio scophthalmi]|uniref:DUF4123 domain-containing protein n=1 Tax=Vibrio scophthalmi LMG 19158 TaxID=870967 RepID=F9RPQ9_9VIBR|nr:DUF4123 domain-containing protein [Vibrio scophthalmi]EGU35533.1 hypothetical protein VIS19158_20007 [Vibrio scophthalmi LMG 19158]